MNKQAFVRTFACAPLLILGIYTAISFHVHRNSNLSTDQTFDDAIILHAIDDTAIFHAINYYMNKASMTTDRNRFSNYITSAKNMTECISTQEGRELAKERIESVRMGTKVPPTDQEADIPTFS